MNYSKTLLIFCAVGAFGCFNKSTETLVALQPEDCIEAPQPIEVNRDLYRNGKDKNAQMMNAVFSTTDIESDQLPSITPSLIEGLNNHLTLLKRFRQQSVHTVDDFTITKRQMKQVVDILLSAPEDIASVANHLEFNQISGKDGRGNLYFTGYYTPTIPANSYKTEEYQFPIYRYPKGFGNVPERAIIDSPNSPLAGQGYEVAYAKYPEDIYYMQVQGSGFVQFPTGETKYLGYDGTNKKKYRSIERYLIENKLVKKGGSVSINGVKKFFKENPHLREEVLFHNPSYIFFDENGDRPLGSGTVPLTPMHSIAVDKDIIPLGSVLLGAIPIYKDGRIINHEYRFLLAQDVGGAINGTGHVDLYSGSGDRGKDVASQLHHYGKLWLIKPKAQT